MAHYSNLNRPTVLALGDTVDFTVNGDTYSHTVDQLRRSNRLYLNNADGSNLEIFDALDILDPVAFARVAYGYEPTGDKFPRAAAGDFAALTRVVNALYDTIPADASPAPAPVTASEPVYPAPVTVRSGKYTVTISLTDYGITITIN